jgi:carotenoid cleavage dioxygenase-like enzyme
MYAVSSNSPGRCFPFQRVVKADLDSQEVSGWWECPQHCFLGEPIFVADTSKKEAYQEDAGWVLVVMYECSSGGYAGSELGKSKTTNLSGRLARYAPGEFVAW